MSHELKGGVSIVGVGCTAFGDLLDTPALKGLTLQELAARAALEALQDARMTGQDVDAIIAGNVMVQTSHMPSTYSQISKWVGAGLKAGVHIDAACATTNVGATLAAQGIAAGTWDRVLVVGVEATRSRPKGMSPYERERMSTQETWIWTDMCVNQAYGVTQGYDIFPNYNGILALAYMRKHRMSEEDFDRGMFEIARQRREVGAMNERAILQETLEAEADRLGYGSAWEMWTSRHNPYVAWPSRFRSVVTPADGASAMVLTRKELAGAHNDVPIDLIGFGNAQSDLQWYGEDPTFWVLDDIAFRQAYGMARIKPADIDYLHVHDCSHIMGAITAERSGYIPEGRFLEYAREGRTRFDGDKPMTTHGGRHAFGHAWAASAGSDTYEAVLQMRGQAGARQIANVPETAVIETQGYALISNVLVLRRA